MVLALDLRDSYSLLMRASVVTVAGHKHFCGGEALALSAGYWIVQRKHRLIWAMQGLDLAACMTSTF